VKSKVALGVAIALAIIAAIGIKTYLEREKQSIKGSQRTVPVMIAARNMRKGDVLTNDMITEEQFDVRMVKHGRVIFPRDLPKVLGQKLTADVKAEEPMLWSYFQTRSGIEDPAVGLTPGYRQITIPVDKVTGCAGRLLPGTIVDVLVTLRVRDERSSQIKPITQTVLTNMRVMATDLHSMEVTRFLSSRQRRDFASYSTVTLRTLPLQSNLLAFLADQGKMHLIIRGPADPTATDPSKIEKVTMDNLDSVIQKAAKEELPVIPPPKKPE
jgi:pilus assembly protein CpaB